MTSKPEVAAEIAERWPEAVAIAKQFRDVFGPDTKLTFARNQAGETIGRSAWSSDRPSAKVLKSPHKQACEHLSQNPLI